VKAKAGRKVTDLYSVQINIERKVQVTDPQEEGQRMLALLTKVSEITDNLEGYTITGIYIDQEHILDD
jgi:hypothetical protein